jgi:imidazolonepropionase-like amidohydrolase
MWLAPGAVYEVSIYEKRGLSHLVRPSLGGPSSPQDVRYSLAHFPATYGTTGGKLFREKRVGEMRLPDVWVTGVGVERKVSVASALIRNVRLLDGPVEGHWDVEIRESRLRDIRAHRQADSATDIPVLDGGGMYLLPGLIDLHVHLVWDGSSDPVEQLSKESTEQTLLRAIRHAWETLAAGVTTVRDLGSVDDLAIDLARAVERGDVVGPRIVPSGQTIIMTGGHDPFWGIMVDGPQEALKATRRQVYRGAGVIKLSATGGVYGRTEGESVTHTELNFDEISTITSEAHKLGVPVAAHAIGHAGIRNCVEAEVDTIEHGQQLTPELANKLAAYGGALVPTLFVYRQIAQRTEVPEYARVKAKAILDEHKRAIEAAGAAIVRIGAGSDAGSPLTPHGSLIDELMALADTGFSPLETLRCATCEAARIIGLDGEVGSIEPGFVADLILVPQNPLEDLGHLRDVRAVWVGGGWFTVDSSP